MQLWTPRVARSAVGTLTMNWSTVLRVSLVFVFFMLFWLLKLLMWLRDAFGMRSGDGFLFYIAKLRHSQIAIIRCGTLAIRILSFELCAKRILNYSILNYCCPANNHPSLYCLANWLTKLNLYVFMAFWMKAALVTHYAWQLTLASATIGYEICQHSAYFLPTFVGIHEFCPTYVCAKYWEKHWTSGWCMSLDTCDCKSCTHSVPFPRRGIAGGVCLLRLYLKFVMSDDLLSCLF